ncbi:Cys/Met metabolism PLP-dependent enzyme-domain-containing protein, partial [Chytriomyces sp. MP71]
MNADPYLDFSTLAIHADMGVESGSVDIAAPLHVSTTFEYPTDYNLRIALSKGVVTESDALGAHLLSPGLPGKPQQDQPLVYSRMATTTRDRVESVLGALDHGHAVTYASGLAAIHAAFVFFNPSRIFMARAGYHGSHGVLDLFKRGRQEVEVIFLSEADSMPPKDAVFKRGDLVWLEMPQNPNGEIFDIPAFKARCETGAIVAVDLTFAPPPLMYGLDLGADCVMHASTKFLGGHSDLLGGVLVVKDEEIAKGLRSDRTFLGSVMGNMEAWLLLRSLRTLDVRVLRQSESATALAAWLANPPEADAKALSVVAKVHHASLQQPDLLVRLNNARPSGVLAIEFTSAQHAILMCNRLKLFKNATSLGGVESLIDWRRAFDDKIAGG